MRAVVFSIWITWAVGCAFASAQLGEAQKLSIEVRSPFFPPGYQPLAAQSKAQDSNVTLEIRGVADYRPNAPGLQLNLYDQVKKKSYWVGLQDSRAPYYVESYDAAKGMARVRAVGGEKAIFLIQPSGKSLPIDVGAPFPPTLENTTLQGAQAQQPAEKLESNPPTQNQQGPNLEDQERREAIRQRLLEAFKRYAAKKEEEQGGR